MQRSIVFKSRAMQEIEARIGRSLEAYFQEKYVDQQLDQRAIAADLEVDKSTVSKWMDVLGVQARRTGRRAKAAA